MIPSVNNWKSLFVIAVAATFHLSACVASANLIVQDLGSSHLAFEAESFASLDDINSDGDNWTTVSDAGASGGSMIQATGPATGTSFNHSNDGEAVYNLEFTKPTDFYWVLARYRSSGSGSADSLLTSSVNPTHADPLRRWFDGPAITNRSLGSTGAGNYYYSFLGSTAAVTAGTYEFRVGIREKDVELDRFIFVDSSAGGPANGLVTLGRSMDAAAGLTVLDNLANSMIVISSVPEPSAVAFGSLVLVLMGTSKMARRQSKCRQNK